MQYVHEMLNYANVDLWIILHLDWHGSDNYVYLEDHRLLTTDILPDVHIESQTQAKTMFFTVLP